MPPSSPSADAVGLAAIWQRRGPLACLLFPVSLVFQFLAAIRRALYRASVFRVERMPVPVVVVGNITAGGTGKTPLVIHLAQALRELGCSPGIVSRGYLGASTSVVEVEPGSAPGVVGDEPLLLRRRSGCPVFVGRDRPDAVRALLAGHPECDVILADDGLQHYSLARDMEIALFDQRGVMNGWCLPAGPLREPLVRLSDVDAVVLNGTTVSPAPTFAGRVFEMCVQGEVFYRLDDPQVTCHATDLAGKDMHAVAGIGSPQGFFRQLTGMGLRFSAHPFGDHHDFRAGELDFVGDAILTTEKDAVKLARLSLPLPVWVLPVTAETSPDLAAFVLEKINGCASA